MSLNIYPSLTQTIRAIRSRGFNNFFIFQNGKLYCPHTNKTYAQQDIQIVEYHRFNRDEKHPEASIIFALVSKEGEKGYVISSEKNMASKQLLQFMDKVKVQPRRSQRNSSR